MKKRLLDDYRQDRLTKEVFHIIEANQSKEGEIIYKIKSNKKQCELYITNNQKSFWCRTIKISKLKAVLFW